MCSALLFVAIAAASPPAATNLREEASRHFRLGVQLAGEGNYLGAAVEFKRAYELAPQFAVLYNLGQAYVGADRPVEAVDALQRYLTEGAAQVPAARQREVSDTIRQQSARIGEILVRASPDGAVVRVDGREAGTAPLPAPVRVAVGEHTVIVSAEGRRTDSRTVDVAAGDRVTVDVRLETDVAAPPPPVVVVPPPPVEARSEPEPIVNTPPPPAPAPVEAPVLERPRPTNALRIAAWVTTLAGVAALGGGVIAGIMTIGPYEAEKAASRANDLEAYRTAKAQADRAALAANVMYGIGGALAVAGLVMLFVSWPKSDDLSAGLFPGGVWFAARF